jgi:glutamyl-tRNA(Gln) amidotransferase subunit E
MDYEKIGFKAGLEIHQQLDTHKLFCNCQSEITEDVDYSFERILRPTQSEMGHVDKAALLEAKKNRRFLYTASNKSTCLVEADEEPPHDVNQDAVDLCLTMAVFLNAKPVDEIHFMRKIVIDGSNTTGFQRTALISLSGEVENVGVQTICLEEDAARKIQEKEKLVNYGLDRLGIPLIEIATDPDIKNPEHARDVAERIGMLLKATGKVKHGLGTIRQDLNISIKNGARVEIKGIQSLSSISKVAEKETLRQKNLIEIKETLKNRKISKDKIENKTWDITKLLEKTDSKIVQKQIKKGLGKVIKLPGFNGLLKNKKSILGKEMAVYAKVACGIGGIIHSDELPGYGIKQNTIEKIKQDLKIEKNDAFVIAIGKEKTVNDALKTVTQRAKKSIYGVLEEVRRALPDDTTEYMRPLPGAARMYPETDVVPTRIKKEYLKKIKKNLPEKPEEKHKRFIKEYKLNNEQTKQLLSSGYDQDFEKLIKKYPKLKNNIIRTFVNTYPELESENIETGNISLKILDEIFKGLKDNKYAKEAIPTLLKYLSVNSDHSLDEAIKKCGVASVDSDEVEKIIQKIVQEKKSFIKERNMNSLGPLMGVAMKKLRGKADGQKVSKILNKEIKKILEKD